MLFPEIIAHRGASEDSPENTLAAVNLAWKQQADAVEVDVHLSRDGRIVVIHDKDTARTANLQRPISEQSLRDLRELDAGSWKNSRFAREKIPLLEEVIATIPPGKRLVIEAKCGPEIVTELRKLLSGSGRTSEQFLLISFSEATLCALKQALPEIKTLWLHGFDSAQNPLHLLPQLEELIGQARNAGCAGLNLHQGWFACLDGTSKANLVEKVKRAGLECYVWTVDDLSLTRQLCEAGVNGITTNRPHSVRQFLSL